MSRVRQFNHVRPASFRAGPFVFLDRKHLFTIQWGTAPARQPWHTSWALIDGGFHSRDPTGVGRVRVPAAVFRAEHCIDRHQGLKNLFGSPASRLLVRLGVARLARLKGHGGRKLGLWAKNPIGMGAYIQ